MLSHLVAVQDQLRDLNAELDAKLDRVAQLNMQLYEMNRVKSDFMATMSHELRTPLNSIIGFSDLLRSGMSGPVNDQQRKQLEMINHSGTHLLRLVNELLDLSRIESGKVELGSSRHCRRPRNGGRRHRDGRA